MPPAQSAAIPRPRRLGHRVRGLTGPRAGARPALGRPRAGAAPRGSEIERRGRTAQIAAGAAARRRARPRRERTPSGGRGGPHRSRRPPARRRRRRQLDEQRRLVAAARGGARREHRHALARARARRGSRRADGDPGHAAAHGRLQRPARRHKAPRAPRCGCDSHRQGRPHAGRRRAVPPAGLPVQDRRARAAVGRGDRLSREGGANGRRRAPRLCAAQLGPGCGADARRGRGARRRHRARAAARVLSRARTT